MGRHSFRKAGAAGPASAGVNVEFLPMCCKTFQLCNGYRCTTCRVQAQPRTNEDDSHLVQGRCMPHVDANNRSDACLRLMVVLK